MMAFESSIGYVNPQVNLLVTLLVVVNLLLVGLAWYNLKAINRSLQEFFKAELDWCKSSKEDRERLAEAVNSVFLKHTHDDSGKVV